MILENCKDYNILKIKLNQQQLQSINKILQHYEDYISKWYDSKLINGYTDELRDYTDYTQKYGNDYVIEWYEGLIDTTEFIDIINNDYELKEI